MIYSRLLITVIAILICLSFVVSNHNDDELISCGGYVRVSKHLSKGKLSYTNDNIKVRLLADNNNDVRVKETTECSPNGYYFLPIYDRGQYIIEINGRDGWAFDNKQIKLSIQNVGEGCKEDINFELIGFRVNGKVSSKGCSLKSTSSLDGIKVLLKSKKTGDVIAETSTKNGGNYVFDAVVPSNDLVVVAQSDHLQFSTNSIPIKFEWGNHIVESDIVVEGFDVHGSISYDNQPIKDVDFYLLSTNTNQPITNCNLNNNNPPSIDNYKSQCQVKSNDKGQFRFKNIPCGKYRVVAQYSSVEGVKYDISPSYFEFQVQDGEVDLNNLAGLFEIKGFTVSGQVVNQQNEGISGVSILVQGKPTTTTDKSGYYTLNQVTPGVYTIEAKKDHMTFDSISNFKLTPSTFKQGTLPSIKVKTFSLCGQVHVPTPPQSLKVNPREVTLQQSTGRNGEEKKLMTDQNGKFCFDVVPGIYTVSLVVSPQEQSKGLQFVSQSITTTVTNKPQLDLLFSQTRASIAGRIKSIQLFSQDDPIPTGLSVSLQSTRQDMDKVNAILSLSKKGEITFNFRDLLPGTYKITAQFNAWCWSTSETTIEITDTEDKENIEFVQSGYYLDVHSPHDQVTLVHQTPEETNYKLKKGNNEICLKQSGQHVFKVKSCFQFEKESYAFDTSGNVRGNIVLKVEKFQLSGTINVEKVTDHSTLASTLMVNVYNRNNNNQLITTIKATQDKQQPTVYKYTYMASLEEELEFEPVSSSLLFYPQKRIATINSESCIPALDAMVGRPGIFLTGTVHPKVDQVQITVTDDSTETVINTVKTNVNGDYKVGPLYDDKSYTIQATKQGYHFKKELNTNNFNSIELGSLIVHVKDSSQSGSDVLQGVLISLTGEGGFRNNQRTQSNGTVGFYQLFPGQYFIRALLKEYSMNPSSMSVEIQEGKEKRIELEGTRVAFSILGSVKSLIGKGHPQVTIQAFNEKNEVVEETVSDESGHYRIRGLTPNSPYIIKLKGLTTHRSTPIAHQITLKDKSDRSNVNFITVAHSSPNSIYLTGNIENQQQQPLRVLLYNSGQIYKSIELDHFISFFDFGLVPVKVTNNGGDDSSKYIIKIEHASNGVIHTSNEIDASNIEAGSSHHVTIQLDSSSTSSSSPNTKSNSNTQTETSVPVVYLLFIGFVVSSILYPKQVWETLQLIAKGKLFKKRHGNPNSNKEDTSFLPKELRKSSSSTTKKKTN